MRLLFDENLSPSLPYLLSDVLPDSIHVRDVGMNAEADSLVWKYAKDNDLMIVSNDADMHDLSLVFGTPPKVIWLRWVSINISLFARRFSLIQVTAEAVNLHVAVVRP